VGKRGGRASRGSRACFANASCCVCIWGAPGCVCVLGGGGVPLGDLSRAEAVALIEFEPSGSFVIRNNVDEEGQYILTVSGPPLSAQRRSL
jgi:hypothetical protein